MRQAEEDEYREFVVARLDRLRRTAYLLCRDWHTADDLVSITLARLYRTWTRAKQAENLDAYVRAMLTNAFLDEGRRPWRREEPATAPPDRADASPYPAGVATVVLGVALVTGHLGSARTPSVGAEPGSSVTDSVPSDETPEQRYARLSELLRTRIAAVLPEVTIRSYHPDYPDLLFGENQEAVEGVLGPTFVGYDTAMASLGVTAPQGSMDFAVFITRPLTPPLPQPTAGVMGRLFGGCAGEWSTTTPAVSGQDTCEDRVGPGGTAVSIAERHFGNDTVLMITVAFPEGGVVTVITDPAATLLSPDDLVEIVADPGFVAG